MFNIIKGELIKQNNSPVIIKNGEIIKKENLEELKENTINIKNKEKEDLIKKIEEKRIELEELEKDIEERIEYGNEQAKQILEDAKEKVEYELMVSQNRGYQDGYQSGIEEGKKDAIDNFKAEFEKLGELHNDLIDLKYETYKKNENNIVELAMTIAEKIIKRDLKGDKDLVRRNLEEALKKVPISKKLVIIVNWEDLEYIKSIKDDLLSEIHGVERIEIIEDKSLERGGCILETSIGTIDASISSQLDTIFERIEELKGEQESLDETARDMEGE